jgi:hypothetical protein
MITQDGTRERCSIALELGAHLMQQGNVVPGKRTATAIEVLLATVTLNWRQRGLQAAATSPVAVG